MLNEQPTNEAAEALQQVIDSLSDGHEAIVRPLEPLPTPLTAAEKAFANRLLIVDRRLQFLQELIAQQTFELQFERSERQGEIDALSKHFLSQIAEIRAAQITDNYQIAQTQAEVSRLEQQLESFENTFEPAPSAAIQWVRAIAFALIGAALALGAITASDYVTLSLPAQSVPSVSK